MKFRFCGNADCPDWLLAEVSLLSKMSSVKVKLLTVEIIKSLLGEELDALKVEKLVRGAKLQTADVKAAVVATRHVLLSAVKFRVSASDLDQELQQLGLPKEHVAAVSRTYDNHSKELVQFAAKQSTRLNKLEHISWRVDMPCVAANSQPIVSVNIKRSSDFDSYSSPVRFSCTRDQLDEFLQEIKDARGILQNLEAT